LHKIRLIGGLHTFNLGSLDGLPFSF